MSRAERFFVRTDRYSPGVLVLGIVAVTAAFWCGFIAGATALLRACL